MRCIIQTFLPYPDIIKSVLCLDNKRLGKQRVEAYQILKALNGLSKGWRQHPCVKMWRGYESCLEVYMNCCILEWIGRGFKNTMVLCITDRLELKWDFNELLLELANFYPDWWGNKDFHNSHKSNLLRKYPEHYSQFNWNVPDDLQYVWPVK